jgi:hypothetical protein
MTTQSISPKELIAQASNILTLVQRVEKLLEASIMPLRDHVFQIKDTIVS